LWYLTAKTPVSAGLLQPDAAGQIVAAFQSPALDLQPSGFAVSIEPEGGVPQPTGAIYLASMTQ
jgi:anti-sigma-K factor RskA